MSEAKKDESELSDLLCLRALLTMIKAIITRAGLLVMLPLLPLALLIDIAIGDIMTGVKTTAKQKTIEQYRLFCRYWKDA